MQQSPASPLLHWTARLAHCNWLLSQPSIADIIQTYLKGNMGEDITGSLTAAFTLLPWHPYLPRLHHSRQSAVTVDAATSEASAAINIKKVQLVWLLRVNKTGMSGFSAIFTGTCCLPVSIQGPAAGVLEHFDHEIAITQRLVGNQ